MSVIHSKILLSINRLLGVLMELTCRKAFTLNINFHSVFVPPPLKSFPRPVRFIRIISLVLRLLHYNIGMSDNSKGILLTLGSVVFFALMAVLVKAVPNVSSYQTTFFRFAIGLGILRILSLFGIINLRFNDKKNLFLRGIVGGIAVYLFYLAIIKLGVGKGSVYVYSYPIFATLFSMLIFIGIVATIGQLCMTKGYRYVNVATGSLLQSMVPVFNLLSGWLIFHEQFTTIEMTGAFVIVGSCFALVVINFRIGKKTRILKLVE